MLSPKKLLENARNRIAKRENWTTGTLAVDALGHRVPPTDPSATCWCSLGALAAEAGTIEDPYGDNVPFDKLPENYRDAVRILAGAIRPGEENRPNPAGTVLVFNDGFGRDYPQEHEVVLEAFDRAIASMRGE
jgi:hypothetical protein